MQTDSLPGNEHRHLAAYLQSLPDLTPRQIEGRIRELGYEGQDRAVRAASLFAFRHLALLRKIYVDRVPAEELPRKSNLLFVGPTGCGKTYLTELLFREIIRLPTAMVDMTEYSETGYVGQDVRSILTRLLYAAEMNSVAASVGIVCMDEFDKLASGGNRAVFAGAGTTKDVTGLGVQRELLKMLESAEVTVPVELSHSDYSPRAVLSTRHISFIACGAFSGLKGSIARQEGGHIGFGRVPSPPGAIAVSYTEDEVNSARNFHEYGFLPELMGRFSRIIPFTALDEGQLRAILEKRVAGSWRRELALFGIELYLSPEVIDRVVRESLHRETGARGIESSLAGILEDAAFEAYSSAGSRRLTVHVREGRIVHECS